MPTEQKTTPRLSATERYLRWSIIGNSVWTLAVTAYMAWLAWSLT